MPTIGRDEVRLSGCSEYVVSSCYSLLLHVSVSVHIIIPIGTATAEYDEADAVSITVITVVVLRQLAKPTMSRDR
jgi:hypothetical protein